MKALSGCPASLRHDLNLPQDMVFFAEAAQHIARLSRVLVGKSLSLSVSLSLLLSVSLVFLSVSLSVSLLLFLPFMPIDFVLFECL